MCEIKFYAFLEFTEVRGKITINIDRYLQNIALCNLQKYYNFHT
jgi:hypothetical protein